MNLDILEQLIRMMENSTLSSMEVEVEGLKVKLEKPVSSNIEVVKKISQSSTEKKIYAESAQDLEDISQQKEEEEGFNYIKAPMVGTFYSAPSPDKASFTEVGQKVEKGNVLCIIEAMKLMNEIEAEEEGTIIEILVHDGDMVEYGQPMFKIKK